MNKLQIIEKFNNVLRYAKQNYIRLLIEIEPDYKKIWIYTDRGNEKAIASQLKKHGLCDVRNTGINIVKWTLTNKKIYYPGNKPKMHFLNVAKGEIAQRFMKHDVNVTEERNDRYIIYYVEIGNDIPEIIKDRFTLLISMITEKEINRIPEMLDYYGYDKTYKFNRLSKKELALYRY